MIKIIAYIFLVFGGLIVFHNWLLYFNSRKTGKLTPPIPIFGSVLIGFGLLCFYQTQNYAWIGIIIDYYGTLSFFIDIPRIVRKDWGISTANQLYKFTSKANGRTYDISLFEDSTFTINLKHDVYVPCDDNENYAQSFSFTGEWELIETGFLLKNHEKNSSAEITVSNGKYFMFESNYSGNNEYFYDQKNSLELTMSN